MSLLMLGDRWPPSISSSFHSHHLTSMHTLVDGARTSFVVATLLAINACITGVVEMPPDTTAFSPPPVYATWWAMVESCSGLSRPPSEIAWYVVPGNTVTLRGVDADGAFIADARGPHIVLTSRARDDGVLVRHEMLHALLRKPAHPRAQFLGRCAGEVNCPASCVADAGLAAARRTPPVQLASTAVDVSGRINPAAPGLQLDSGYFRYVVTARNLSDTAIRVVDQTQIGAPPARAAFRYELTDSLGTRYIGGALSTDESRTIFEAGETKTQVFDFRIGVDPVEQQPPPGRYSLRGRFGNQYSDSVDVRLLP